ncbi:hypothetical protein [Methanorbis furvi]|uniref:Uncharacterized protein n=1 Tax=Methanorbis furvi TaxID=3028299 RepID=A0AAE4MCQ0_9EURY|nr:hypothetical protein [Methanocorpusculaceae archaeon Ag1]
MQIDGKSVAVAATCILLGLCCGVLLTLVLVPWGAENHATFDFLEQKSTLEPVIGTWFGSTSFAGIFTLQSTLVFYDDQSGNVVYELSSPLISVQKTGFDFTWEKADEQTYTAKNSVFVMPYSLSDGKHTLKTILNPSIIGMSDLDVLSIDLRYVKQNAG